MAELSWRKALLNHASVHVSKHKESDDERSVLPEPSDQINSLASIRIISVSRRPLEESLMQWKSPGCVGVSSEPGENFPSQLAPKRGLNLKVPGKTSGLAAYVRALSTGKVQTPNNAKR